MHLLTLLQSHTGLYMAKILRDVLVELGIKGKVSDHHEQYVEAEDAADHCTHH